MPDILKQLQAHVDFLAETGRRSMDVDFDDLNNAVAEIERLQEEVKGLKGYVAAHMLETGSCGNGQQS